MKYFCRTGSTTGRPIARAARYARKVRAPQGAVLPNGKGRGRYLLRHRQCNRKQPPPRKRGGKGEKAG